MGKKLEKNGTVEIVEIKKDTLMATGEKFLAVNFVMKQKGKKVDEAILSFNEGVEKHTIKKEVKKYAMRSFEEIRQRNENESKNKENKKVDSMIDELKNNKITL